MIILGFKAIEAARKRFKRSINLQRS